MAAKLKEHMKNPKAPLATRSAYQLFLSKECARLRTLRGESQEGQDILRVAIDAWRQLTEKEKEVQICEFCYIISCTCLLHDTTSDISVQRKVFLLV